MNNDLKGQTENILKELKNKEIDEETRAIRLQEKDPLFSLKTVLFDFFKKRLMVIQEADVFRDYIKQTILQKMEDNEFSVAQLINLYAEVSSSNTFATNSVLDIFKPGKDGAVSPIVQPQHTEESDNAIASEIGKLTPDEAEALVSLRGIIDKIKSQKGKEKEATE